MANWWSREKSVFNELLIIHPFFYPLLAQHAYACTSSFLFQRSPPAQACQPGKKKFRPLLATVIRCHGGGGHKHGQR